MSATVQAAEAVSGEAPVRQCSVCSRSRGEIQHETLWTDAGRPVHGALFCLDCYLKTHPGRLIPEMPPPARRPPARRPEWVAFRYRVSAALARHGTVFHDRNHIAGRCPICELPLLVRFIPSEPEADFICSRGCDERRIVAKLGKAPR